MFGAGATVCAQPDRSRAAIIAAPKPIRSFEFLLSRFIRATSHYVLLIFQLERFRVFGDRSRLAFMLARCSTEKNGTLVPWSKSYRRDELWHLRTMVV